MHLIETLLSTGCVPQWHENTY